MGLIVLNFKKGGVLLRIVSGFLPFAGEHHHAQYRFSLAPAFGEESYDTGNRRKGQIAILCRSRS